MKHETARFSAFNPSTAAPLLSTLQPINQSTAAGSQPINPSTNQPINSRRLSTLQPFNQSTNQQPQALNSSPAALNPSTKIPSFINLSLLAIFVS